MLAQFSSQTTKILPTICMYAEEVTPTHAVVIGVLHQPTDHYNVQDRQILLLIFCNVHVRYHLPFQFSCVMCDVIKNES